MQDLKSQFRTHVKGFDCRGSTPKEFEAIWFKADYWDYDDVHNGIVDKFYLPLDFAAKLLAEEMEREHLGKLNTSIVVMPALEGPTYAVVVGNGLLLEEYSCKAGNLWWQSSKDFKDWVEERLKRWREKLQVQLVPKKAWDELVAAYRQYAQEEGEPQKAFDEFTRVCEAYLQV